MTLWRGAHRRLTRALSGLTIRSISEQAGVGFADQVPTALIKDSVAPRIWGAGMHLVKASSQGDSHWLSKVAPQGQGAGFHSSHHPDAAASPRSRRSQTSKPAGHAGGSPASQAGIGTIYVQCTKNNTICTLVGPEGMPLAWASAGSCGFKNARKKSTQVSQTVAETLLEKVLAKGFKEVRIVMKGLGYGKQSAVRALTKSTLKILEIHEQTAVPHNGCRAPRRRRI